MKQNIQDYLKKVKEKAKDGLNKIRYSINSREMGGSPRISLKMAVGVAVPLIVFVAVLWFFVHFSVREVIVLGNVHYTKEEITKTVQRGIFGGNTFLVSRGRKSFSPENLDLVDQINVEMKDEHTLLITVQERQLIGYVQYLDCNLYFDSEGRVMNSIVREEASEEDEEMQVLTAEAVGKIATSYVTAMKEAPLIRGLSFAWARLHEILPVENTSVFNTILGISRMINKYNIAPDAVDFDENMNITLAYGKITVDLGPDKLMEEKLARVAAILPSIEGKQGILHMEDYDGSSENIVFSQGALTAEEIEGDDAETATDGQETISHEYALVIPENSTGLQSGAGRQNTESLPQNEGDLTQGTQQQGQTGRTEGTQQQGMTGQTEGTQQQGTIGQAQETQQQGTIDQNTGTVQQGATGQTAQPGQTGAAGQGASSPSTGGNQDIRIDKPVLNNLP